MTPRRIDPAAQQAARQRALLSRFDHLLALLREQGGSALAAQALSREGLTRADVQRGSARLGFDAYYRLLDWLHGIGLVSVPGLRLGLRQCVADFGVLGQVIHTARTVGEAIRLGERFFAVSAAYARMEVFLADAQVVVRFAIQPFAPCDATLLPQLLIGTGLAVFTEVLPEADRGAIEARLPFARPPDAREYRRVLGTRVLFGQPHAELRMPADWLAVPLRWTPRAAREQDEALKLLHRIEAEATVVERVRHVLQHHWTEGAWRLEAVAAVLDLSPRTLRRRLADEGSTFRVLLEEVRMALALALIERSRMPLAEVAATAGYAHLPSFTRAFCSRFGCPPSAWRRGGVGPKGKPTALA